MTSDDPNWPWVTRNDHRLRINLLCHETKEKCENCTENTPYQRTSMADNFFLRGVGKLPTLHQNDPENLLYNFRIEK